MLEGLVRAGFIARGITYGLVGAIALGIALGAGTDHASASQQGALSLIAREPLGKVALIAVAAGMLAYALWKLTLAVIGHGPEGGGGSSAGVRIANLGGGVAYLGLCGLAVEVLAGSGGSSSGSPRHAAAGVLGWPGGQWLVGIAGVATVAISLYMVYDAIKGGFAKQSKTEEMGVEERRLFMVLGRAGMSARALVFALIGYFILRTAIDYQPSKAVGVDGALGRLHHEPLGPWLLGLVALGLVIFATFSMFEARYRRL